MQVQEWPYIHRVIIYAGPCIYIVHIGLIRESVDQFFRADVEDYMQRKRSTILHNWNVCSEIESID